MKPAAGFIGLGIMGLAMAKNAKKAGFPVATYNRSEGRRGEAKAAGLPVFLSPREVAEKSRAVIVIVTDAAAVRSVLTGPDGVLAAKVKGKTLIQMSTIDEASTLEFAEEAGKKGMKFLDCPVTGSKKQVEEAQLILLAGGEKKRIQEWRPLLLSLGKAIVHAGGVGKGTVLKLCMNLIVAQMTTALCESVALARAQNLDPRRIFEVIAESPALNCGYFKIKEKAVLEENFSPAFSLDNMLKDVRFMDQAAKRSRLPLPVTQAVRYLMEAAVTDGHGPEDLTSIAHVLKPNAEKYASRNGR